MAYQQRDARIAGFLFILWLVIVAGIALLIGGRL
jgi:hypothetical protein